MSKLLNYVAHSNFLQSLASITVINLLPISINHNLIYTLSIDDIKGNYIEYGVFTVSCIKHAARCYKRFKLFSTKLYGLDSFSGFPQNIHQEFKNENFISDYNYVKKIEKKFNNISIIKGFFNESIKEIDKKIKKISFGFIDCDLAVLATPCLIQLSKKMVPGGFIMIDDFFNVGKKQKSIYKEFFKYFKLNKNIFIYKYFGIGGICLRYLS